MSRDRLGQLKAERQRQQQYQSQPPQHEQQHYGYIEEPVSYGQGQSTVSLHGGSSTTELVPARMHTSETHYRKDNRNQYEMQGMGYGNAPVIQQQAGKSQNDFFDEVDQLSATLNKLKRVIEQISNLHTRVLTSSADEQREHEAREELEYTTKDMQRQMAAAKSALETLSAWPPTQGGENDKQARRMQVGSQKKKFMDLIQEYREVEARSREKYRERMARQYKIVKPDATPEEVREAVESDRSAQVFATALTESTRYHDSRNVYREVQERQRDITKIAESLVELQALFNDLANMVEQQDHQIITIEQTAQTVAKDMETGEKEITKGKESAKKARSKRKCCAWVIALILLAAAIAITIYILKKNGTI